MEVRLTMDFFFLEADVQKSKSDTDAPVLDQP